MPDETAAQKELREAIDHKRETQQALKDANDQLARDNPNGKTQTPQVALSEASRDEAIRLNNAANERWASAQAAVEKEQRERENAQQPTAPAAAPEAPPPPTAPAAPPPPTHHEGPGEHGGMSSRQAGGGYAGRDDTGGGANKV